MFEEVKGRLESRYRRVADGGIEALKSEPYLIVVICSRDALGYISETQDLMNAYNDMAKQYASMRVLFVFGDMADSSVSYSSPALLKALKDEKRAFIATNMPDHKMFEVSPAVVRANRAPLEEGQAYYLSDTEVVKVKIASAQQDDGASKKNLFG